MERPRDRVDDILAQWRRERPELDVTAMGLIGRVSRLQRRLGLAMERTFAAHGLTGPGFDVLATLRRAGPPFRLPPGELLATMMVSSGAMTNRIDQLAKAGLVARTANPEDGRSVLIALTDRGRATIDAAVTDHLATQARLVAALPATEAAALTDLLRRFLVRLEGDTPDAAGTREAGRDGG